MGSIANLFPTPVACINIDRNFTEDELKLLTRDIAFNPPSESGDGAMNHRSEDFYLFDK